MAKEKSRKKIATDDDPYLEPIPLPIEIGKKILRLINKVSDEKIQGDVYLQNKLSDPNVHPNDYLKFEEPSDFKFEYVLTTCKGVYMLSNLITPLPMDNETFKSAHQNLVEEATESRSEAMQNELDDLTSEYKLPPLPDECISPDEIIQREPEENLSEMKIHEVFSLFTSACCQKRKDGICHKRHYLIGIGDVSINDQIYSGVHIYLYPDSNFYQVDIPEEKIMDTLYLRFQKEKKNPKIQKLREEYKNAYLEEFNQLLSLF